MQFGHLPEGTVITNRLDEILDRRGSEKRIHYALDRIQAALKTVGNPDKNVQTLVIAGTNGKGSTTLYLSSVLESAVHRVTTYLSPHLQSPV